jgi:hypothetical protein
VQNSCAIVASNAHKNAQEFEIFRLSLDLDYLVWPEMTDGLNNHAVICEYVGDVSVTHVIAQSKRLYLK